MAIAAGQIFCQVVEPIEMAARIAKWDSGKCTYAFEAHLAQLGREAQLRLTDLAVHEIHKVCGISIGKWPDPNTCNIKIGASRRPADRYFDGPMGVLAYAGLPYPGTQQVPLNFDLDESWTAIDPNLQSIAPALLDAVSGGGVMTIEEAIAGIQFFWVCLHELGHAVGLPHAAPGSDNVMAPTYNPNRTGWGRWDIEQFVLRYGPPKPLPDDPPPTDPVADIRVSIAGVTYKLVRAA